MSDFVTIGLATLGTVVGAGASRWIVPEKVGQLLRYAPAAIGIISLASCTTLPSLTVTSAPLAISYTLQGGDRATMIPGITCWLCIVALMIASGILGLDMDLKLCCPWLFGDDV